MRAGKAAAALIALFLALAGHAAAEPVRIVALGDSLTQGYGLAPEDGFVPQLQAWLAARGAEAEVINAGVSGDTTAGGAARVEWTLAGGADALIVALGGNDMLRGLDPENARENLEKILAAAERAAVPVLLIGIAAPVNYGPDYKDAFDAIWPELAARHGALLVPDFLAPLRAAIAAGADRARLMQPDGIHPSAEGVRLMVEAVGPRVLELLARVE
ncbi:acyl-CoA thioesterase-1 [Meinhardsimonia xiamenensis]|uniref:Acyl-CoA thioesterase-1 n=1 Tax=Meinhardsimonia xiamenensis TaxID=990712 RepID=A0A1G8YSK7_9RHOB|nr:acyl-CoA thioesterase-1 [Meinhardsimonia xiamenensis]SDK05424.1 acyl-CoA thioesterase-1 [Meinhardsimonia xiamenensis]